jgi:hypothetical protein
MKLCKFSDACFDEVVKLFSRVFQERYRYLPEAVRLGFLHQRLGQLPKVNAAAWVLKEGDAVAGFVSAHVEDAGHGVITTPVVDSSVSGGVETLLEVAEKFLAVQNVREIGINAIAREYGVGLGDSVYMQLLNRGYEAGEFGESEVAMEIDLTHFQMSPVVEAYKRKNEQAGLTFELLRQDDAESLTQIAPAKWMLAGLANKIPGDSVRYPYIICRQGKNVIGFCVGCEVRPAGIGSWSFIYLDGWTPERNGQYYHRGIGAVMMSLANHWLKERGARVQVLFTGITNPAQRLYFKNGYRFCFVSVRTHAHKNNCNERDESAEPVHETPTGLTQLYARG